MKILIALICTLAMLSSVKADTIDFWHVYYNKVKIREYNQYSKGVITLPIKDIKKTDTLTVRYFRDTPCSNCETRVAVENEAHVVIANVNGYGTFNPISVSVSDLLQHALKPGKAVYDVFYSERQSTNPTPSVLIFKIKLE